MQISVDLIGQEVAAIIHAYLNTSFTNDLSLSDCIKYNPAKLVKHVSVKPMSFWND